LLILAIETSGEENILCLGNEEEIIWQRIIPGSASKEIYPLLHTLLKQKDRKIQEVKGIVVSLGPGSFTGLRVGISVAKALAFSLNIPVVGIPTPDLWASSCNLEGIICVIYKAHKRDTYYGNFYSKNEGNSIFPDQPSEMRRVEPFPFLLSLKEIIQRARKFFPRKVNFIVVKEAKIAEKIKKENPDFSTLCKRIFPLNSFLSLGIERIKRGKTDNIFTLTPIYLSCAEIKIRQMRKNDLPRVSEIERLSFPIPWPQSAFLKELDKKEFAFWWVIEYKKLIVGYGGYWKIKDEAHIVNLAIHPDFRKKGLGTKLLSFLLTQIQNQRLSTITLEVRESNVIAQRLYEKFGFRKIAIRPHYYIYEDAIVYWKKLPD